MAIATVSLILFPRLPLLLLWLLGVFPLRAYIHTQTLNNVKIEQLAGDIPMYVLRVDNLSVTAPDMVTGMIEMVNLVQYNLVIQYTHGERIHTTAPYLTLLSYSFNG